MKIKKKSQKMSRTRKIFQNSKTGHTQEVDQKRMKIKITGI